MKMMISWDERMIKESSVVLIDNGVVVDEVDSSLRWGDGECLLDTDSAPKCSTDLTTSGLLLNRGLISHPYVYSMIDSWGGKSYIFNITNRQFSSKQF
jgi:hypothetical protein